ncbi:MAG: peptide-methionine (R)-S-oxide reductase MsrB [Achromobacter mucicolens]
MNLKRRHFLGLGGAAAAAAGLAPLLATRGGSAQAASATASFPYTLTDAQWRERLTREQYQVLRRDGTERPYSSPLNDEHRKGTFACAGCALPLFSSDTKFESGTGWPSFYAPLQGAVETKTDRSFFMKRVEVHCARCIGHLGHVFDDGPKPTGLRYCMNGVSLKFEPAPGAA